MAPRKAERYGSFTFEWRRKPAVHWHVPRCSLFFHPKNDEILATLAGIEKDDLPVQLRSLWGRGIFSSRCSLLNVHSGCWRGRYLKRIASKAIPKRSSLKLVEMTTPFSV